MYVETKFDKLQEDDLRNAVAGSSKTKLHKLKKRNIKSAEADPVFRDFDGTIKVAFPNDRAQSIRPFDRKENYQ